MLSKGPLAPFALPSAAPAADCKCALGPSRRFVYPVPHDVDGVVRDSAFATSAGMEVIAVWPRRICNVRASMNRGSPSQVDELVPTTVFDTWLQREAALQLEWSSLHESVTASSCYGGIRACAWASFLCGRGAESAHHAHALGGARCHRLPAQRVIQAAPSLPLLALADALRQRGVPRASALSAACVALLRHDRLFSLSLFFGVPLLDRTGTLTGALRVATTARPPPTRAEVERERQRLFGGVVGWCAADAVVHRPRDMVRTTLVSQQKHAAASVNPPDLHEWVDTICQEALQQACLSRAEALWTESECVSPPREIRLMWSGVIPPHHRQRPRNLHGDVCVDGPRARQHTLMHLVHMC